MQVELGLLTAMYPESVTLARMQQHLQDLQSAGFLAPVRAPVSWAFCQVGCRGWRALRQIS